jgi:hypothetical protein
VSYEDEQAVQQRDDDKELWLGFQSAADKLDHELGVMQDSLWGNDGVGITEEIVRDWEEQFPKGTLIGDLVRAVARERGIDA